MGLARVTPNEGEQPTPARAKRHQGKGRADDVALA